MRKYFCKFRNDKKLDNIIIIIIKMNKKYKYITNQKKWQEYGSEKNNKSFVKC